MVRGRVATRWAMTASAKRSGVGQHVAGVGDQRQTVNEPPGHRLDDHERGGETERPQEPPFGGHPVVVTMTSVIVRLIRAMPRPVSVRMDGPVLVRPVSVMRMLGHGHRYHAPIWRQRLSRRGPRSPPRSPPRPPPGPSRRGPRCGRARFAGLRDALLGALALFALGEREELAAREADLALAIDRDDLHLDLVAFLHARLRRARRASCAISEMWSEAVGAREDLDERAEVGDALDGALVDRADLGLGGEALDDVERLLHRVRSRSTRC